MQEVIRTARQIALTDHTVLIRGESGTVKELIAQSIHNASYRSKYPFVAVNCAALPDSLLESELFGYEKGAFTGAAPKGQRGLFEKANHGTIFLDEIGDISPKLQLRLLRTCLLYTSNFSLIFLVSSSMMSRACRYGPLSNNWEPM